MTTRDKPAHPQATAAPGAVSPFGPFRHQAFAVVWTATVVSNIGSWMQSAAGSWLMTGLDPDPLSVSLVQVAASLPLFLFGLPAGALADVVDRRRLLVAMEVVGTALCAIFAATVWLGHATAFTLILFTFLIGTANAMIAPAWQSVVPQLVPRGELPQAVALNSVGINISRAVGPALAGVIIAWMGLAAPFWLNAVSGLGVIAALVWWRPHAGVARDLPAEALGSAIRAGLRYARFNPPLRATLYRAIGFFVFASAYWALLPLVARDQIKGSATLYGILLGAIGIGAVGGAFVIPRIKARLGPDNLVVAGSIGTAIAMLLYAIARQPVVALLASLIAGISWIGVLATLNVSAQVALPEWVRGRGLALYVTIMFGAMTLGSVLWGEAASLWGLSAAQFAAAIAALLAIPLMRRWRLQTGADLDLTPSMHWPVPVLPDGVGHDQGPVLVTVEYRIDNASRDRFLAAINRLAGERRRDGAYQWGIFEDTQKPGRYLETFVVDSWLEHLRQHERVTQADRALQDRIEALQTVGTPVVTHLLAARRSSK